MATQQIVAGLRTTLAQSQTTLGNRFAAFQSESALRAQQAQTDTTNQLNLLRGVFNQNLSNVESSRLDIESLNQLLSKQIGSAPVGFSRFTNPRVSSSFTKRPSRTRRSTIFAATQGSKKKSNRALGQGARA